MNKLALIFYFTLLLLLGCHMLGIKPPQLLTPEDGAEIKDARPLLTWSPCDSVHSYRVLIAMDNNFQIALQDTFVFDTHYRLSDSLKIGESRYWTVGAISRKGVNGPWAKIQSFRRIKADIQ